MSSKKYDSFRDVRIGKYDWKVQAKVLNLWRGYSRTGEAFKGFNLLLLDSKRARMHAFVPGMIADEYEQKIQVGKIYYIENFTIKNYRTEDKFRCVRNENQIIINNDTILEPLEENQASIERCWFDLYELGDLRPLSKQTTFLNDVIGVIEEHDLIGKIRNVNWVIQSQIKFKITDGSKSVQVTFWDEFAEYFAEMLKEETVYPVILIIGSARVTLWREEVILTNVGATTFYINCNHRSVVEIRKMIAQNMFSKNKLANGGKRCATIYMVKDIKNLGDDFIESHILCQVKLTKFQQVKTWCHPICTSCYERVHVLNNEDTCSFYKRVVPYADKKFEVYITANDETGSILLILEDREVRSLMGKTVFQMMNEGNKLEVFPNIFHTILNKHYTVKICLTEVNIHRKTNIYVVTNIMEGFYSELIHEQQKSIPHPIESMESQVSFNE
ncbi:hypothetical protein POM88_054473 [Heracleum sosnowskyi]|uniref:Replication protein A 70 kDa DNA-binding subunit B/D first OB fold domain-containing protein n=1 Tax=Heracleum sosnowskyi TaxID=360622 RepID=A0AAD8GN50_9APIA|nr:hypothetical protein POM88_054473 [Heracleum sosnowskyi]